MRKHIATLAAALVTLPLSGGLAHAAGAGGPVTDIDFTFEGPFGTFDQYQLQRGFQVYHQICAGCHGMKFVSFRELGNENGPNMPEEQIKAIAAEYQVLDTGPDAMLGDTRPGVPADKFPANDMMGAPDFSLIAKARAGFHGPYGTGLSQLFNGMGGPEYIYSLLVGYNGKDKEVGSAYLYGNDIYPGGYINMAPPLYGDDVVYEDYDPDDSYTPPEATLEQQAEDVAAFLMWAAEPKMVERKEAGFRNLVWLIILAVLLYFTNKKIWAPVKRGDV
ncbi:MAG: cytochrome c1 [Pseudomonadota bacterium]